MNNLEEHLHKIKEALHPMYQSIADTCRSAHQNYLTKENQRKYNERINKIQINGNEIQQELALALQQSHYPKLQQINSVMDLRQDGYVIYNGRVVYYFTIDKTIWDFFPIAVCKILCNNINKDIITYTKQLEFCIGCDAQGLYPALYYGIRVVNVEDQQTAVRLAVITRCPL